MQTTFVLTSVWYLAPGVSGAASDVTLGVSLKFQEKQQLGPLRGTHHAVDVTIACAS